MQIETIVEYDMDITWLWTQYFIKYFSNIVYNFE